MPVSSHENGSVARTSAGSWTAAAVMVLVGLVALRLPHFLRERAGVAAYGTCPGPVLLVTAAAALMGLTGGYRY